MRAILVPKLVSETCKRTFDFASLLPAAVTISTQTVTATVYSGTDSSPSALISGSASASGSVVTQAFTAGTAGVLYELKCVITTSDSQTLVIVAYLAVIQDLP